MRYQEITIKELASFVKSNVYLNSKNIPITQQRALSQIKNPRASKEDVALIIAIDKQNEIVGFIGALPEKIPAKPKLKIAWNSCWWIDRKNGQKAAIPLFLKFLKAYDQNVLFRDLTPKTEEILMRFNKFEKIKKLKGFRYFLFLNSKEIITKRNRIFIIFSPILQVTDKITNTFLFYKNKKHLTKKSDLKAVKINAIDKEAANFIKEHQKKELFKRGEKELNWILKNPWILKKTLKKDVQFYYFSDTSRKFKNDIYKLYNLENNLIAVLFFNNNDGLVKIPFIYFNADYLEEIKNFIFTYLLQEKANSLLIFNPLLNKALQDSNHPFWYIKPLNKDFVVSKKLKPLLPKEYDFQDGEGDFVFA